MLQSAIDIDNGEALTERQKDVLDAALRLLVEAGDTLTMTALRAAPAVPRKASTNGSAIATDC